MSDIYFERTVEGSERRAYTRIDFNRAALGNRWLERTWSGFFGTTTSLISQAGEQEWVAAQNPEFLIVVDGETIDPMTLSEIEVSESCSDLGASLLIRKARRGLDLTITSTALHELPAMMRVVTIKNTGAEPVRLESVTSDILEWEEKDGELVGHRFFKTLSATHLCGPEDPCIAMLYDNRGMLFGRLGEGELHAHAPEQFQSQINWVCDVTLNSMEKWTSPATYIMPCGTDPLASYLKLEPELVAQIKLAERREAEIIESLKAEDDPLASP